MRALAWSVRACAISCASLAPRVVQACPFCSSETGLLVHAGIFNTSMGATAMLVLSPFAVFLLAAGGVVALLPQASALPSETPHPPGETP